MPRRRLEKRPPRAMASGSESAGQAQAAVNGAVDKGTEIAGQAQAAVTGAVENAKASVTGAMDK